MLGPPDSPMEVTAVPKGLVLLGSPALFFYCADCIPARATACSTRRLYGFRNSAPVPSRRASGAPNRRDGIRRTVYRNTRRKYGRLTESTAVSLVYVQSVRFSAVHGRRTWAGNMVSI